jgi:uncharacterized protein YqgC (DUF456 family)
MHLCARLSMIPILWWLLSGSLIAVGLVGTVLPALPGTLLVLAGMFLGAWINDFNLVGWGTLSVLTVLAVLALVLDYVAGFIGGQKAGASRDALLGAAIGTIVGIFMGLVGVLFMPLVGASVGEYIAQRNHHKAMRVGVFTWIGSMLGMVAKVVITFMMVGVFAIALMI